jgi:hypothetical protein
MLYLSAAASNAASIEDQALSAGSKKGGAAKGELVLAIFELANSFRHGWGVKKDPIAAKQVCGMRAQPPFPRGDDGKSAGLKRDLKSWIVTGLDMVRRRMLTNAVLRDSCQSRRHR